MFYPVESLKRGGRFYLCWVADSWPLRFAAITHRQLWSQDIRKLCDDLLEVMINESGRPTNRFSLRLSSQLMRGLVRLYERKVTVFLGDLCMLNAHVFKNANKKWIVHDIVTVENVERPLPQLQLPAAAVSEEPEKESRVEELIQNSGNFVGNIQDITLKEAAIPEFQLPPNDGFGEEHPDQALQLLGDRTIELMLLQPDASAVQHSGLDLPLDTTDKSHDKSRLAPHDAPQMERISEHDVTLFRKSTADDLLPTGEFEKDIPEIPEIPHPELPALPHPEKIIEQPTLEAVSAGDVRMDRAISTAQEKVPVDIELEELEEAQQTKKRRGKNKLIIDKRTKLSSNFLRARIDNTTVELRCEDSTDDIVDIRVPWDLYVRRPARAGTHFTSRVSDVILRMFQRNLAVVDKQPLAERELEKVAAEQTYQREVRPTLEKIVEEEELQQMQVEVQARMEPPPEADITRVVLNETASAEQRVSAYEPIDITDLPTQKLEMLSQARERTSEYETPTKRRRMSGYISYRESQSQQSQKEIVDSVHKVPSDPDKENIPPKPTQRSMGPTIRSTPQNVSTMLQEAGLADIQPHASEPVQVIEALERRKNGSDTSETPLGSLDRTKVSLGDSVNTTDSQRFIRNQWGIEGTMIKILSAIKSEMSQVTVENLIARGPVISGYKSIIAARCFTSILKLKQHGFIKIDKDPNTLEIRDITLGHMFDNME